MKSRYLLIICFLFSITHSFAQYRTEILFQNEQYQLNGGLRASVGGKSRIAIPIAVPTGSVGIIYTLVATRVSDATSSLNLAIKLGTLLSSGGVLASCANQLQLPRGTETVDAYLMDDPNYRNNFEAKNDQAWRFYRDFSRLACQSCAVFIPITPTTLNNKLYLGLKNPSSLDGINVQLNAFAIYKE